MSSASQRLLTELQRDLPFLIEEATEKFEKLCESPIETLLLASFTLMFALEGWTDFSADTPRCAVMPELVDPLPTRCIVIKPQHQWQSYRIDFAVFYGHTNPRVFVECDGHEFHERTPEQAERDRRRDRQIQQAGIPVIRFTGREIVRNPIDCSTQMLNFITSTIKR